MTRTVLRGAYALRGSGLEFQRRGLDVLIEGKRITAIEAANAIHDADEVIDLSRRLLVPGLINCHMAHLPAPGRRAGSARHHPRAGDARLQVVTGLEFYGVPIVEYLARIGFLGPRTSLIHAVWLNPREIRALADSGATAQHNPWSNLTLGSGVQPTRALLDAGVNVSMGSDGACSTVSMNMLQVVGTAAALSKVRGDDYAAWLSAREALTAATQGGARALGFGTDLGVIERGAIADLVAYRLDTVPFTPLNDPVRQLVYAERGAGLDFAMVAGDVMVRGGRFTRVDEARLLAEIEAEFAGLESQYAAAEASVAPVRAAMDALYRRSLATGIPTDTYPARLP